MRKASLYLTASALAVLIIFRGVLQMLGAQTPIQDMFGVMLFCTLAVVAAIVGKDR